MLKIRLEHLNGASSAREVKKLKIPPQAGAPGFWAKLLGVTAPQQNATPRHKAGRTSVDSMTWVKDGTPVAILYSVQNGGHAMPLEGEDLNSPIVIWDFSSKFPSR